MEISAHASAEANFIKVEGTPKFSFSPEITFNWQKGNFDNRSSFPMRLLEGASRAINPVGYEEKLAEARAIHAKSICECYSFYKETMPSLTDNQAFLLANGYSFSPSEADNVAYVLSESSACCSDDADPDKLDTQFKDLFIKGSSTAYDDEVRQIWTDLLNGEFQHPGTFSKKTLNVLKSMDRNDVEIFKALCSFSVLTPSSKRPSPVLKTINRDGWTYNNGGITFDQLGTLAALGLIDRESWTSYALEPHSAQEYVGAAQHIYVKNRTQKVIKFDFGNAMFLSSGVELASLCETGNSEILFELIEQVLAGSGLDVETTFDSNEIL